MLNRLTSLERVRDWVGSTSNGDDILLTRLIDEVSRYTLSYIQRPTLFQHVFADVYDGAGQRAQTLRNWPVISVASVQIGNQVITPASTPTSCGYVLDAYDGFPPGRPQAISLRGHEFWRGHQNIAITYTAGFVVTNEAQSVPSAANYSIAVNAPLGSWGADQGVAYANGTPLTPITYNPATTLSAGQYMAQGGNYYFASADANAAVLISYSFIPADIEHACMEMVGERYSYKSRVGTVSKSLGGQETVSYSQKDMPDFVKTMLQPYKRVVMV